MIAKFIYLEWKSFTRSASFGSNLALKIVLGLVAVLYSFMFLMAGASKFFTPLETLRTSMEWAKHTSDAVIYLAGFAEILGGLGLILPSLLRIMPWLTSLAALGLSIVMLLAAALNGSIGESNAIMPTILIAGIALFVAWGRYKKVPISAK